MFLSTCRKTSFFAIYRPVSKTTSFPLTSLSLDTHYFAAKLSAADNTNQEKHILWHNFIIIMTIFHRYFIIFVFALSFNHQLTGECFLTRAGRNIAFLAFPGPGLDVKAQSRYSVAPAWALPELFEAELRIVLTFCYVVKKFGQILPFYLKLPKSNIQFKAVGDLVVLIPALIRAFFQNLSTENQHQKTRLVSNLTVAKSD